MRGGHLLLNGLSVLDLLSNGLLDGLGVLDGPGLHRLSVLDLLLGTVVGTRGAPVRFSRAGNDS
jgi:hypothetical protein